METFWQPTASAIQVSVSGKDDASSKKMFEHLIGLPFIDIFVLYLSHISYFMNPSGTTCS